MNDTWNPGYPVHIYQEGVELPKEGTYFVVAGNGLWMHKDTGICRAFVPVENISFLPDLNVENEVHVALPKLPLQEAWRIKEFFRRVVAWCHSEAATVLYFNKEQSTFHVHVPEQRVSHSGVNYKRSGMTHIEGMEGFLMVGTIHSHCDFRASHSGTDVGDEQYFDGLHVTFGHNDQEEFSISASLVVNGVRTKIDPKSCIEGIELVEGTHDTYRFVIIEEEQVIAWCQGIDEWMLNVKGPRSYTSYSPAVDWSVGDKVSWNPESLTPRLVELHGEGPFEVLNVEPGRTRVRFSSGGTARFPNNLLKRTP